VPEYGSGRSRLDTNLTQFGCSQVLTGREARAWPRGASRVRLGMAVRIPYAPLSPFLASRLRLTKRVGREHACRPSARGAYPGAYLESQRSRLLSLSWPARAPRSRSIPSRSTVPRSGRISAQGVRSSDSAGLEAVFTQTAKGLNSPPLAPGGRGV
jgi:hypothetical protein